MLKSQTLLFLFFFLPPKFTYRGEISQVLMLHEEVLHLPVIQTIHLHGVDSLRVVCLPSLLFPPFPSLGKVSAGKGEMDPSLRAVLGRGHTGTCSSHFGTIPGAEPHIPSGMIPTVPHFCRLGVPPSRNGINPPSRLLQSS